MSRSTPPWMVTMDAPPRVRPSRAPVAQRRSTGHRLVVPWPLAAHRGNGPPRPRATRCLAGEWLYFTDMGAYTACAGSNFNGMALPDVVYLQVIGRPSPPPRCPRGCGHIRRVQLAPRAIDHSCATRVARVAGFLADDDV